MPATAASQHAPTVEQPKHPLHESTTFELRDYRRQLENAIAFYEKNHPHAPVLADLRQGLAGVQAEQESRKKIADA
jgi:hypothetical protein